MELVCPAGGVPAVKAAVDNGADAVYVGLNDQTNARHFPGLNLTGTRLEQGIEYARRSGVRVYLAVNTYASTQQWHRWEQAVDLAAALDVDALIAADLGVLNDAAERHPNLRLHLSVQGSATTPEALAFYQKTFNVRRAVLPRVLSLPQVEVLAAEAPVDIEVFGFGGLCIMAEGRCLLSSYATGCSPNTHGVCSPPWAVRWHEGKQALEARLNGVLIERYDAQEKAGYPTLCKGRFRVEEDVFHVLEEPASLNTLDLLPQLAQAGVRAVKIEGRQRSPAYVAQVTRVWRQALDAYQREPAQFVAQAEWQRALRDVSEGSQTTFGAYHRSWQ